MIKGKFGSAVRSKSDTGQINEALRKVLSRNIRVLIQAMHTFNVHPIFGSGSPREPKNAVQEHFWCNPLGSRSVNLC